VGETARAAVVVVNYGSHELLADGLLNTALPESVLGVVVDNFFTAAERTAIAELCERAGWEAVLSAENGGFGGGMNAGVARAASLGVHTLLLINPDAVVSTEAIDRLIRAAEESPDTIWTPIIRLSDGRPAFGGGTVDLARGTLSARTLPGPDDRNVAPWLSGACMALSMTLWQRIGGFDHDYFMYWEDVDFSVRAHRSGARLSMLGDVVVTHDPGGTQRSTSQPSAKSPLYVRYNCRNRLVFAAKLVDPAWHRSWILRAPGYAREVSLRSGRRALLRRPSLIAAAFSGTLQGLVFWGRSALRRDPRAPRQPGH
jgi:GT2 family glycosyltransferase